MAGRHQPPSAPPRTVRRLVAALQTPAGRRLPGARWLTAAGLVVSTALLTATELLPHATAGIGLRAAMAATLGTGLAVAIWRLRARVELLEGFRRGQDAMGEALLVSDPVAKRVVYASPAAVELFGRPADELCGVPLRDLVAPAEQRVIDARHSLRAAGHRIPERITVPIAHTGTGPRYVEWATVPLPVDGHDFLLSLGRDVTARLLAERRLADEHAFLEAVLEFAAGPIVVLGPDGRLTRVNRATAKLAGMEPAEMIGRTPWELGVMTPGEAAEVATALREGRDPFHHSITWRGPGGTERFVVWSATAMRDESGQIRSAVSVGVDVTRQRAAEERARRAHAALDLRSHELERSNRELAQFAELAARDMRDSVQAVARLAEQLEDRAGPALDAHARDLLDGTREVAADMEALLEGLTEYRRLGTGEALAQDVDCDRTLDAVLAELAAEIDLRGASITRDPLPTVPGDPDELGMLFSNLVAGALGQAGGEVPGAAPRVHVGAARFGLGWQLTVSGDAGGVPGGITLALCQRIAERHGGAVWVDRPEFGGSAFHVTLADREAR
jgi:PAS domain S-box-containing protein